MNAQTNRPQFIKKLTPKTVTEAAYGKDFLAKIGETRPVKARELYKLFGQIARLKQGHTNLGDYVQFKGRFRAVTPEGEVFDGGAAHIPVLEDMLFTVLSEAQSSDSKAVIEIAVSIGIQPAPAGKPSATGYEYTAHNLVERTEASDPIARLMAEAGVGATPALAAPASDTASAPSEKSPEVKPEHHRAGARRR